MEFKPRLPREGINRSPTHPLKEAVVLVVGVAVVAGALFLVLGLTLDKVISHLPVALEQRLFHPVWSRFHEDPGNDGDAVHLLQPLLDRLAAHWAENPYSLRVGLMAEEHPNAFALPGGMVMVTTGLLRSVASENELAFVLAHEIGHFRNRDHLRRLSRQLAFALVLAALGGGDSMEVVGGLAALSFDRRQEEEADRFGLRVVQQEYGHVAGSLDFFTRLGRQEGEGGGRITAYFATHPLSDQRIETMRTVAQERGWSFHGELLPLPGELSPQNEEPEDDPVNDGADDLASGQGLGLVGRGYRFDMVEHLCILGGFACLSPYRHARVLSL